MRGASRSSRTAVGCGGREGHERRAWPTRTAKSCGPAPDARRAIESRRAADCGRHPAMACADTSREPEMPLARARRSVVFAWRRRATASSVSTRRARCTRGRRQRMDSRQTIEMIEDEHALSISISPSPSCKRRHPGNRIEGRPAPSCPGRTASAAHGDSRCRKAATSPRRAAQRANAWRPYSTGIPHRHHLRA